MAKSEYEASLETLRTQREGAVDAVRAVPRETRASYRGAFTRLERVLAYAGVTLTATDARLVSGTVQTNLSAAFQQVRDYIETQPQSADAFSSAVLDALSQLPVPRGRLTEQKATDAAEKFARSSRARLAGVSREVNELRTEISALGERLGEQRTELEELVAEAKTNSAGLISETRAQLETLEGRIEAALTDQAEVFRAAQEERAGDFTKSMEAFGDELNTTVTTANERADALVSEIERKDTDARKLLAALGVTGTAGRWAQEAKRERTTANRWRWATVLVVIAAVAVALLSARADSLDDPVFVSRILISAALGGLAAYTAKQSGRHRNREERARRLELELAAFGPFIEPLPEELQHQQRGKMVERTFGRPDVPAELDGGPGVLSQIPRRPESPSPDDVAG
jgi:hypothetical protein